MSRRHLQPIRYSVHLRPRGQWRRPALWLTAVLTMLAGLLALSEQARLASVWLRGGPA